MSKAQNHKNIGLLPKPCHVCTLWKALAEYYRMGTNVPGFQSLFNFFQMILFSPNRLPATQWLTINLKDFYWTYDTFDNNFVIKYDFTKYLKESCW